MHDAAIELLIIGNNPSEIEGYLSALRNSGIAVHGHQLSHDSKALSSAIENPIDLILYTCETGDLDIGLPEIMKTLRSRDMAIPVIALADSNDSETKRQLMHQGASDLVQRKDNHLLVPIVQRELDHITTLRELIGIKHKLLETEERCNLLTESSHDAIGYIHQGMHVKANSTYLQLFGLAKEEDIEGLPILDLVAASAHELFKKLLRQLDNAKHQEATINTTCLHTDGREFKAELSFQPAIIEAEACTQVIIRKQSLNREVEEKLQRLSTRDPHTDLYNRQHFINTLEDIFQANPKTVSDHVLLYITLDNFKQIRDKGGMLAADSIINELALVLREIVSKDDLLARFGDHTFTLLTRLQERDAIINLAEKICRLTKQHDYKDGHLIGQPSCSIGIVRSAPEITTVHEFIDLAYQAWDLASAKGTNQVHLTADVIPGAATSVTGHEADLEKLISDALEHDQFRLVYQPIVSLHGDTRENYAVLVRLLDNNQEEIHPDHFLPCAEASGKMLELDRWVIHKAITELTQYRRMGHKVNFFINISGPSLDDQMLLLWICDCLRELQAKGSWLVFQVKEEDAINRPQQLQQLLQGLKKIKCKISVDHFGLAPKPNAALQNLPIDFVQFDQQLVAGLAGDQDRQDRLNELNRTVQKSAVKTIAAGVDDTHGLTILWSIGVNYIRGYFIQEPSPNINFDFKMESSIG